MLTEVEPTNLLFAFAIIALLFIASLRYDRFVAQRQENSPTEGYSSLLVVWGVAYTQAAITLIVWLLVGLETAIVVMVISCLAYMASGTPMIYGDMERSPRIRRRLQVHDPLKIAKDNIAGLEWMNDDDTA
jgi:hypothetical protein